MQNRDTARSNRLGNGRGFSFVEMLVCVIFMMILLIALGQTMFHSRRHAETQKADTAQHQSRNEIIQEFTSVLQYVEGIEKTADSHFRFTQGGTTMTYYAADGFLYRQENALGPEILLEGISGFSVTLDTFNKDGAVVARRMTIQFTMTQGIKPLNVIHTVMLLNTPTVVGF